MAKSDSQAIKTQELSEGQKNANEEWRVYFDRQIEKFQKLPDGSDSWSPHRPANYTVGTARVIAERLAACVKGNIPKLIMAATSEGGMQLKWSKPERELSFLIYPDQSIDYLFVTSDRTVRKSGSLDAIGEIDEIAELLLR